MFLLEPSIFPWDLAILLLLSTFLSGVIVCLLWLRRHRSAPLMQRSLLSVLSILSIFSFLVIAYGSFIEPRIITVTERQIALPLAQPLKIVVLADLHVGPYKGDDFVARAVSEVNRHLPDLVLLAGDYVYDQKSDLEALESLRNLRASLGTYAVLGNHEAGYHLSLRGKPVRKADRSEEAQAALEALGITVLRNRNVTIPLGNENIAIAGIDDVWTDTATLSGALAGIPEGMPTILLSHHPDIILDPESHRAHLIVSGHTHGGQIRLPFLGPVPPLPTELGKAYDQGLFTIDEDTTLAITRGIGETGPRARLFAWPEILLLRALSFSPPPLGEG